MSKTLTVGQVARLLKISERSVYRNVEQGKLPAAKPTGGRLLFREEDLSRVLAGRFRQQQQEACASG
jgi:excisionase family DNA binding protein